MANPKLPQNRSWGTGFSPPSSGRGASNAANPVGHVRLVGETSFCCDSGQALGSPRDAKPGLTCAQLGSKHCRCDPVCRRESSGHSFSSQTIHLCPLADLRQIVLSQGCRQKIRPVVSPPRGRGTAFLESICRRPHERPFRRSALACLLRSNNRGPLLRWYLTNPAV